MTAARRRLIGALGVAALALVSLFTHALAWVAVTGQCEGAFDTGPLPPAPASSQGRLCAGDFEPWWAPGVWHGAFILGAIACVVAVVAAWRRWGPAVGVPALLLLGVVPWLVAVLLTLPSDDCTSDQRATHPHWACSRG